jgi:translation initiation factor 2B subunit (eIF-2B alpha/beta/delta family)
MIAQEVIQLADRFQKLELHAARGGREVLCVLLELIEERSKTSIRELADEVRENITYLLKSLPPYAPPLNSINQVLLILEEMETMPVDQQEIKRQLVVLKTGTQNITLLHRKIADGLAEILPPEAVIYTHTLSETVLGVLLELYRRGRLHRVAVTESRPNNDGWTTALRLADKGVNVCLTIDAAMPAAIENSHLMVSGSEIINPDGSIVGKIGTHLAAMVCQYYQKPLYVVANSNKICPIPWKDFYHNQFTESDLGIPSSISPLQVTGSYFDITPARYICAYATEKGLLCSQDISEKVNEMRVSRWLTQWVAESC